MQNFRSLQIWEYAKDLSVEIYKITKDFPPEEKYGITSQIRRAANSISANIAEGAGRNTNKDFANFVNIAIGSTAEVESYVELAHSLEFLDHSTYKDIIGRIETLRRKSINFNKQLRN